MSTAVNETATKLARRRSCFAARRSLVRCARHRYYTALNYRSVPINATQQYGVLHFCICLYCCVVPLAQLEAERERELLRPLASRPRGAVVPSAEQERSRSSFPRQGASLLLGTRRSFAHVKSTTERGAQRLYVCSMLRFTKGATVAKYSITCVRVNSLLLYSSYTGIK